HLRHSEPYALRRGQEFVGKIHPSGSCERYGGGFGGSQKHAGRFSRIYHQCAGRERLSHIELHVAFDPLADFRSRKTRGHQDIPEMDDHGRAEVLRGSRLRAAPESSGGKGRKRNCQDPVTSYGWLGGGNQLPNGGYVLEA